MPYVNGIHKAGIAEAVRLAQAVIHRDVEAGMVVAAGQRADRARAARVPEARPGERVSERRRDGEGRRRRRGQPDEERRVDLQA